MHTYGLKTPYVDREHQEGCHHVATALNYSFGATHHKEQVCSKSCSDSCSSSFKTSYAATVRSVFTALAEAMAPTLAITVALEHSSFHNTDIICRLLCISKEVRGQVLKSCAGQLPLTASIDIANADQANRLALWIKRHGRLLKVWDFRSDIHQDINPLFCSRFLTALQEAAKESPLLLQSFSMDCSVTAALLQQLPVQHLTQLSFVHDSTPTSDECIRSSLSKLTNLQELTVALYDQFFNSTDALVPALSALSNLTRLSLESSVRIVALLQQLPQQLIDLEVLLRRDMEEYYCDLYDSSNRDLPKNAVQLGHLTALTRLAALEDSNFIVRQHDELPPNVKALFVEDCRVCQPLLHLSQLQQLSMSCSTTPKEELQLLSQLTALTDVSLLYYCDSYDAAAAAWTAVPGLRCLVLDCSQLESAQLTDAVAEKIAKLTSLTELLVTGLDMHRHTAACLQKAVEKLTALKTLTCIGLGIWQGNTPTILPPSEAPPGSFASLPVCSTLASIIAGLPSLSSLNLRGPMTSEAAKILARASQLTYMSLRGCNVSDYMVESFLPNMLELRSLDLSGNSKVTGSCVDVILVHPRLD